MKGILAVLFIMLILGIIAIEVTIVGVSTGEISVFKAIIALSLVQIAWACLAAYAFFRLPQIQETRHK